MKIVQLDIEGFRSLKNVSWKPGDLNVIIGPNGSGKSNLLRMLELISAAAQGKLGRSVQSAGGIGALVWDGRAKNISFQVTTSPPIGFDAAFAYQVELSQLGNSNAYQIGGEVLMTGHTRLERQGLFGRIIDPDRNSLISVAETAIKGEESLVSLAASPLAGFSPIEAFQKQLTAWAIYQDLRVDQTAPIRQASVSRLEERVAPDGQNLINVLHTLYTGNRAFKQDINDAMFAAFGEDFEELIFPPDAGDQRVQMRVRWKTLQRDQSTADLSDGTLRFLFLLTVLASPNPPPLIAIDEPETGLHPSMLPIIAEFAVEAATRTQVIFTTHSSQFLDAFRETRPTTTVAKWENGETTLTTLNDEELSYWLEDYSLGNLFRSGELENLAS